MGYLLRQLILNDLFHFPLEVHVYRQDNILPAMTRLHKFGINDASILRDVLDLFLLSLENILVLQFYITLPNSVIAVVSFGEVRIDQILRESFLR